VDRKPNWRVNSRTRRVRFHHRLEPIACAPHGLPSASLVAHFLPAQTLKELRMPGAIPRILRLLPLIRLWLSTSACPPLRQVSLSTRRGFILSFRAENYSPKWAPIGLSFVLWVLPEPSTRRRDRRSPYPWDTGGYISLGTIHGARPISTPLVSTRSGNYPRDSSSRWEHKRTLKDWSRPDNFVVRQVFPQWTCFNAPMFFYPRRGEQRDRGALLWGAALVILLHAEQWIGARRVEAWARHSPGGPARAEAR